MCKQVIRFFSMLLIMAMLINMLPMQVLGEALRDAMAEPEAAPTLSGATAAVKDAKIVREITENRTEYSKEFLLSNGLRIASVYPDAVHYETQDGWQEIDNTLTAKSDGTLANTAGVWEVRLPQQMSSDQAVTITKDGYRLSFAMAGELRGVSAQKQTRAAAAQTFTVHSAQTVAAKIEKVDLTKAKAAVHYEQIIPEKLQSRLTYSQVYQNTDVVYDLDSNKVKESIVLKQYSSALQGYRYTLDVGQLVPVLEEDGRITFYDTKREHIVMSMPAPFLVDDAGERSADIQVQLTGSGSAYTLTYLLPQQWLADTARVWPVILDPAVSANVAATNIQDRRISQNVTFAYDHHLLEAGRDNTYGKTRSYLKFVELPKISASDVVVGATIHLYQPTTRTDPSMKLCVEVRAVHSAWTSQGITWANQPALNPIVEDYCMVQGTPGYYGWVITDMVRQWYSGENHGLVFKSTDANESSTGENWMQFYSSDAGYNKPILTVTIRNNNGLESYWDYTATSAGRAGTGYVNNFTGNLVWVHPDIGFGGNRMPVSISHIYNANDAQKNEYGLGYGWRTNFNQRAYEWTDPNSGTVYYVWEDEDGTKHYFVSEDGVYKDEDGLELTLTVGSDGTSKYVLTDKNGNTSHFDTDGRLRKQQNNQATPSSITVTYTTDNKIDTVTDGVGRRYVFTYTDDLLDRISYKGSGTEEISYVSFEYDEFDQLTYIWNADLDAARYAYANNGALCEAIDVGGYRICYTYKSTVADYQPYRVVGISEYDYNTAGGSLTLQYAKNQTTITDHNGNAQILQFNDFGNTISVQDDEGNAQYGTFAFNTDAEEQNNADTTKRRNQLRISSKLQNTVGNRLKNGNFEDGSVWSVWPAGTTCTNVTTEAYMGTHSLLFTATEWSCIMSEEFTVEPGATYTYSAYVKGVSGDSIMMLVNRNDMSGSQMAATSGATQWQRVEVSYTNTGSTSITARAQLFGSAGTQVYLDCAQVEKAPVASRYNLVENGDFRSTNSWTMGANTLVTETSAAKQLEATVCRIVGVPTNWRSVYQYVQQSGSAGDAYVLAGWAKGDSAPLSSEETDANIRSFCLKAIFHNTDGTKTERVLSFNPDMGSQNGWQYAASAVIADKNYSSIQVAAVYDYNVNTAYFDGIQLYKEEFGNTYTYDSNGNVISVKDLQAQTTTYEYTANKLSKEILPTGAELSYVYYEGTHNVKTATTAEGLVYNFAYDVYGNNTSVSISGDGKTMTSTAEYTADGNRLVSTTDTRGFMTFYGYNADTNVLEWVQYPMDWEDTRTEYTYDDLYRVRSVNVSVDSGAEHSAWYQYMSDGQVGQITTGTTTYSFDYGAFSLTDSIWAGMHELASYTYTNDSNRYLTRMDYGNEDHIIYTYDDKGRVLSETYEDGATVSYTYDNTGVLVKVADSAAGKTTEYYYDSTDRMMRYVEKGTGFNHSVTYSYDNKNNLSGQTETINGTSKTISYTYDDDNRIETVSDGTATRVYTYDAFGRLTQRVTKQAETVIQTETFTYWDDVGTATTGQIRTHRIQTSGYDITYEYGYDGNGNIATISDGVNAQYYYYDNANQLFTEAHETQNGVYVSYTSYDDGGNILVEEKFVDGDVPNVTAGIFNYTYNDSLEWGDLLTSYNGQTITSDEIGNMLSDGTWAYTWRHGRQLATMSDGSTTWNYAYDADGLRTMRTNGTDTYTYVYNGGQLSQMTRGTDTLRFSYDASGLPLTVTWNGTTYYYVTNIQGDVIGILNAGGQMVTAYSYDAWGNTFSATGSMAGTLGQINPLRYRGYVYDHETGLYYLQSRYYNPELGRFISADGLVATGQGLLGNNMFAYCGNNPVNRVDPTGQLWGEIIVVITTIIYVLQTVETYFKLKAMGFQNVSFDSAHDCLITMNTNGIDTAEEKAHFFAQCYVESKLSLLEAGWLSEDAAEAYRKERPYYPYYGAGYIQLTWDYNYKAFSEYIGDPLIYDIGPKYVAENYAWSAAGWFWTQNRINDIIANDGSVAAVTRKVNGGYNKLQERTNAYNRFIIIWGG